MGTTWKFDVELTRLSSSPEPLARPESTRLTTCPLYETTLSLYPMYGKTLYGKTLYGKTLYGKTL